MWFCTKQPEKVHVRVGVEHLANRVLYSLFDQSTLDCIHCEICASRA